MSGPTVEVREGELFDGDGNDVIMEVAEDVDAGELGNEVEVDLAADLTESPVARVAFLDYLKSPIIQLLVGKGEDQVTVTAHQDLLTKSPFFEQACAEFTAKTTRRKIDLPDEDPDAVGAFLEFLYLGDYFPRRIGDTKDGTLETDPSIPVPDHTGSQLLRHARIYTLAEKFFMPQLKSLAHTKIHRTTSTARGEIAYARYVYATTPVTDVTIRRPVAAFWATRSHVLRHEAEEEFRSMCLEYPQFGFDVLSIVLDQKEKRSGSGGGVSERGDSLVAHETPGSRSKKRQRVSVGI